jgi:hypothetical protein
MVAQAVPLHVQEACEEIIGLELTIMLQDRGRVEQIYSTDVPG